MLDAVPYGMDEGSWTGRWAINFWVKAKGPDYGHSGQYLYSHYNSSIDPESWDANQVGNLVLHVYVWEGIKSCSSLSKKALSTTGVFG